MSYAVVIEKGETSYGAYVPDLPGCVAVGETREEVEVLIREAIQFHLEMLQEEGFPIPEPTPKQAQVVMKKKISPFPFESARRITANEVAAASKAVRKQFGIEPLSRGSGGLPPQTPPKKVRHITLKIDASLPSYENQSYQKLQAATR